MRYSACIEMLFTEEPNFARRIALARAAGFDAAEFWRWRGKDLDAIEAALAAEGMALAAILAEPVLNLTDPATHADWREGLAMSRDVALRIGAPVLIAQAGAERPGVPRADQTDAVVAALEIAAEVLAGSGVRLGLEPLNTLVDHKGYYLPPTREAIAILDRVARPEIGMVYDIYHSAVMGEPPEVIVGGIAHVLHVHVADHPGRNEPGHGEIDMAGRLAVLKDGGYDGCVGGEFRPSGDSDAASRAFFSAVA